MSPGDKPIEATGSVKIGRIMNIGSALRLTAILTLILLVAAFPGLGSRLGVAPVRGDFICLPGLGACFPTPIQLWVPSGASEDKLQIQVYTDEIAEFTGASATPPQLDLTDTTLSPSFLSTFGSDPRFLVTAPNAEFGMFDIDFNHANTFFGIPDNFGNNPAGVHLRQAVAHLLDKQSFINSVLGGLANPLDNAVPPGQDVLHPGLPNDANSAGVGPYTNGGYNLVGACGWDTLHGAGCLSAYHYAADTVNSFGIVNPGQPDFCDAADHFIAAKLASGKDPTTCVLTGLSASLSGGNIQFIIRKDSPPRLELGTALIAGLCNLITGTSSCTEVTSFQLTPVQAVDLVQSTSTVLLNWWAYTAGWTLTSQFDQLYSLYNSAFASSACGGKLAAFGNNYIYFCRANYDHFTNMLEFNSTLAGAVASAQMAMQIFGQNVATIPVWSGALQLAYLKGWTGVNDASGVSIPNFFTWLNAWNPNPATSCGATTGCGGSPGVIRQGFKQGTVHLNPFLASTTQEIRVIRLVYDTLLAANPYSPNDLFGWMANQFQILPPQPGDPVGTVQDVSFNLRNNMFWHDGVPVTASDVKFTFLACKATQASVCASGVSAVIDVTIVNSFNVRVNMKAMSLFTLFNVGRVLILPQHVWASDTTTKCTTTGSLACTVNPTLLSADPVSTHTLIGSSAWVCKDLTTGQVGGGCTSSGTQAVDAGGTIVLQRNGLGQAGLAQTAYFRDSAKYKLWQWADVFNHGTVDIVDVSNAAACLNKPDGTIIGTTTCTHWDTPSAHVTCTLTAGNCNLPLVAPGGDSAGTVSFIEVSQAFGQFGFSWTQPISYTSLVGAQPIPQALYEGGITYGPCILTAPLC